MPRRWKEIVRELIGSGILRDTHGNTCAASYRFAIQQVCWERPALTAPTTIGRGSYDASGLLSIEGPFGNLDINTDLRLQLEDGSSVAVILTSFSGPHRPTPIVVSDFGHLLPPE